MDFQEVRNYLIAQKSTQKRHYDKRHNIKDLPELHPGQAVLFLSPADTNIYIEGTITGPSTTPHSYTIEAQGRTYCHNREHICLINIHNPTISRPSTHQENPISGPSTQQSPISSPQTTILAKISQLNPPNQATYLPQSAQLPQFAAQLQNIKLTTAISP